MTSQEAPLTKAQLSELAAEFGLGKLAGSSGPVDGWSARRYLLSSSKGRFELRVHRPDEEYELRREIDLLTFFDKHDFPSPRPTVDRHGRFIIEYGGGCLLLLRIPAAQAVAENKLTLKQINDAGHLIGEMHMLGRGYKKSIDNRYGFDRMFETYAAARRRMPTHFKKVVRTLDEEIEYLGNYLESKRPKGIIHGAIHRELLAFKGENVSCLGGFGYACRGKYVFDLATAVNAMCFIDDHYELERFEALMAGYESLRTLSLAEWDSFPNELRFAALRFTIVRLDEFFESTTDQERTRINKDFGAYLERLRVLRREKEGGMEKLLMAMATGYDYRKYQRVAVGDSPRERNK